MEERKRIFQPQQEARMSLPGEEEAKSPLRRIEGEDRAAILGDNADIYDSFSRIPILCPRTMNSDLPPTVYDHCRCEG